LSSFVDVSVAAGVTYERMYGGIC